VFNRHILINYSLPIVATSNPNDDAFDSVVIVASNFDENVLTNQSLDSFKDLKQYKQVQWSF
jgi:hypothetical protein